MSILNRYYSLNRISFSTFFLEVNAQLEVKFRGFKTIYYLTKGCASSACEGVEILNDLAVSSGLLNSFDILY